MIGTMAMHRNQYHLNKCYYIWLLDSIYDIYMYGLPSREKPLKKLMYDKSERSIKTYMINKFYIIISIIYRIKFCDKIN